MIRRTLMKNSIVERLVESNFTAMQGIDVSKSLLDKNYVLDAVNLNVDLDNGLRLRKPLILSKDFSIFASQNNATPLGYLYDNNTFILKAKHNIYYIKDIANTKNCTNIVKFDLYYEKDGQTLSVASESVDAINFEDSELLNTSTSSFITNIKINLKEFGTEIYDTNLYSEDSEFLVYRFGRITITDGKYKLTILQPAINNISLQDNVSINPNLMLDNPYTFRDNYTAEVTSVQGIVAYIMTDENNNPVNSPFPATVKELTETVNKFPKPSIVSNLSVTFQNPVCLKAFLNVKRTSSQTKYICRWEKTYNGINWLDVDEFIGDAKDTFSVQVPSLISQESLDAPSTGYETKKFKYLKPNNQDDNITNRPDCLILNNVDDATFRFLIYTLVSNVDAEYPGYNDVITKISGKDISNIYLPETSVHLLDEYVFDSASDDNVYLSCEFQFNLSVASPSEDIKQKFTMKITYMDDDSTVTIDVPSPNISFETSKMTISYSDSSYPINVRNYLYKCVPVRYEILYNSKLYYESDVVQFYNNYPKSTNDIETISDDQQSQTFSIKTKEELRNSPNFDASTSTITVKISDPLELKSNYSVSKKYGYLKFLGLYVNIDISSYLEYIGVNLQSPNIVKPLYLKLQYNSRIYTTVVVPRNPIENVGDLPTLDPTINTWEAYIKRHNPYKATFDPKAIFGETSHSYVLNLETGKTINYVISKIGEYPTLDTYEVFKSATQRKEIQNASKLLTGFPLGPSNTEPVVTTGLNLSSTQFFITFTDKTEVLFNEFPSPAQGHHLYYNYQIYSYGSGKHKNNILVSDSDSIIFSLYNTIDLNTLNTEDITTLIPWRDYLIAANPTSTYLITKQTVGFTSKLINTFIGVPMEDRKSCNSILNGIVFKSGQKIYSLQPNPYSSNDTILNITEISSPISKYVIPSESFAFTTEEAYYLFMNGENQTVCLKYEYSRKIWEHYIYPLRIIDAKVFNVDNVRLISETKEFYFNKEVQEVIPTEKLSDVDTLFWEENKLYGDVLTTWDTYNPKPIFFLLDSGQKTSNISTTKQFVESKILMSTLHEKDCFPVTLDILVDGMPTKIHFDVSTDSPFWKSETNRDLEVLTTNMFTNNSKIFDIIRQIFVRYSCKGKSIRHIISGNSMYEFKFYVTYYRYREPISKQ